MRIATWSASLTTFLPRSKLRSRTWSPPAQPVETPSVASAEPCLPIACCSARTRTSSAKGSGESPLTRYRVNVTRPFKKPMTFPPRSPPRAARFRREGPASHPPRSLLDRRTEEGSEVRNDTARPRPCQSMAWSGSGEVGELEGVLRSILLEVGDHGLELVELLAGHADLVVHDLGLNLEFKLF